ncbi:MAG TPA: hypothetical protein PKB10_13780, partial [Tepidisphaeraceae bacterium]|nr:hypothetical protein [Tepidisphaeraceae bacterium]
EVVLGGYFALQRHLDYRTTHDVDAWWRTRATQTAIESIRRAVAAVALKHQLQTRERRFGETLAFDLLRDSRAVFSFQIAVRSLALDEPEMSPWPPIGIETIRDNLGAKMNALVDRGAPRDFLDIYHAVHAGLLTADECWTLWTCKNPNETLREAMQKVSYHLTALEHRRPLDSIVDDSARAQASAVRDWFRNIFVRRES